MFGCGPKYLSERLKLERVYKTYALGMANELGKSNTKCSKQHITLWIFLLQKKFKSISKRLQKMNTGKIMFGCGPKYF